MIPPLESGDLIIGAIDLDSTPGPYSRTEYESILDVPSLAKCILVHAKHYEDGTAATTLLISLRQESAIMFNKLRLTKENLATLKELAGEGN